MFSKIRLGWAVAVAVLAILGVNDAPAQSALSKYGKKTDGTLTNPTINSGTLTGTVTNAGTITGGTMTPTTLTATTGTITTLTAPTFGSTTATMTTGTITEAIITTGSIGALSTTTSSSLTNLTVDGWTISIVGTNLLLISGGDTNRFTGVTDAP